MEGRRNRPPASRRGLQRRRHHDLARGARLRVRAGQEALRGRHHHGHRERRRAQGRHQRPAAPVPSDLGRADRRQGQHRRAAVRRALHQDDARPPERHRPVRRLHGRRLLVRRHRACRLRLCRSTSCMASGKYPKWTYDDMPPSLKTLHQWEGVELRRAQRRRRPGPLLPQRHADRCRAPGGVQGRIRLRPAEPAADLAAAARHLEVLQRQELGCHRRRSRQRHGAAPEGRRAGPLSLPVALGLLRHQSRATRSRGPRTSTGSIRTT